MNYQGPSLQCVTLTNATIIDGTGAAPQTNLTIVIEGNRIRDITPEGVVLAPESRAVIDLSGKYVLPGL